MNLINRIYCFFNGHKYKTLWVHIDGSVALKCIKCQKIFDSEDIL
jgi:hypothetical protein